jgi:hypothetical protein
MNKGSKRKYDAKRATVVKFLAAQFSVEPDTVRKAIRGDLKSDTAEEILKEYRKKYAELQQVLS